MKIILLFVLTLPYISFAKTYKCKYFSNGKEQNIKIKTKKSTAKVWLELERNKRTYSNCERIKDDFGVLIDCNRNNLDLMFLLTEEDQIIRGGIMSSTFDLFLDIEC